MEQGVKYGDFPADTRQVQQLQFRNQCGTLRWAEGFNSGEGRGWRLESGWRKSIATATSVQSGCMGKAGLLALLFQSVIYRDHNVAHILWQRISNQLYGYSEFAWILRENRILASLFLLEEYQLWAFYLLKSALKSGPGCSFQVRQLDGAVACGKKCWWSLCLGFEYVG